MTFAGENMIFVRNALRGQHPRQQRRLFEFHITVIIAMYQQDRRAPALDVRNGRGAPFHVMCITVLLW